ncbi:MAG: YncE family protein [Acidobacteriales bacterium]|nr:YncE family protein [Terriglobales bacterium]
MSAHARCQTMLSLAFFVLAAFVLGQPAFSQATWSVTNTFHVGGEGGWDYVTIDSNTRRLYVTRSTHTMVLDAATGKTIGDIPGQKRSHGVALVPELGRGFISDGGGNGAIVIFDLKTNAILGSIPAVPDADGIIYDKFTNRVLAVSGDGGVLMSLSPDVDPHNGKMGPALQLGGSPEFLAADGAGHVYVNLEDKDLVAVVDLKQNKVVSRWPVAPGGKPVGLAMDRQKRLLYIGCRDPQKMIVMNADSGKILADLPIGVGVDATKFDGARAFASCRDGKLFVIAETAPGRFTVVQTVATPAGARTMDMDTSSHAIYLPTAELEPAKQEARPEAKPDTFMIVVVSQQGRK